METPLGRTKVPRMEAIQQLQDWTGLPDSLRVSYGFKKVFTLTIVKVLKLEPSLM